MIKMVLLSRKTCCLILIIMLITSCAPKLDQIPELMLNPVMNNSVSRTIEGILDESESSILILSLVNCQIGQEVRVAVMDTVSMKSFLFYNNGVRLIGYYHYSKDVVIFVIGDYDDQLFSFANGRRTFSYIESKNPKKEYKGPPSLLEPIVWVYRFIDNELIFSEMGRYDLLTSSALSDLQSYHERSDYSEEEICSMLKRFYEGYILEASKIPNSEKISSIKSKYCTSDFLRKVKESELDYDPFLNAQDVDIDWLQTLEIEKDTGWDNLYRVSYIDNYSKESIVIILTVIKESGNYKIDNIDLPY